MGNISRSSKPGGGTGVNAGQTILPADINADMDTIVTEINGLLDSTNLAANSVGTSEIQANAVDTAELASGAVTETKIGAAAVTNTKVAAGIDGAKLVNTSLLDVTGVKQHYGQWRHEQANGVSGGATGTGTWTVCPINTEVVDELSATFAANTITLPAGTYYIRAWHVIYQSGTGRLRWRDTTAGSDEIYGSTIHTGLVSTLDSHPTELAGRFTTAGADFQLQVWTAAADAEGLGRLSAAGIIEVYGSAELWRVA